MDHVSVLPNSTVRLGRNMDNQESGKIWKHEVCPVSPISPGAGRGQRTTDCGMRDAGCSNGGELSRMGSLAYKVDALSVSKLPLSEVPACLGKYRGPCPMLAVLRYLGVCLQWGYRALFAVRNRLGNLTTVGRTTGHSLSTSNLADYCIYYRFVGSDRARPRYSKHLVLLVESCQAIASTCVLGLIGSHTSMFDELSCIRLPAPCFVEPLTSHPASI
ncbi:hypothetical protein F4678DRAFT_85972 [Xylaria arbuscula]|nr:hypothetical protein F4678DRAFT_85972 [Xylaria arbuscula]